MKKRNFLLAILAAMFLPSIGMAQPAFNWSDGQLIERFPQDRFFFLNDSSIVEAPPNNRFVAVRTQLSVDTFAAQMDRFHQVKHEIDSSGTGLHYRWKFVSEPFRYFDSPDILLDVYPMKSGQMWVFRYERHFINKKRKRSKPDTWASLDMLVDYQILMNNIRFGTLIHTPLNYGQSAGVFYLSREELTYYEHDTLFTADAAGNILSFIHFNEYEVREFDLSNQPDGAGNMDHRSTLRVENSSPLNGVEHEGKQLEQRFEWTFGSWGLKTYFFYADTMILEFDKCIRGCDGDYRIIRHVIDPAGRLTRSYVYQSIKDETKDNLHKGEMYTLWQQFSEQSIEDTIYRDYGYYFELRSLVSMKFPDKKTDNIRHSSISDKWKIEPEEARIYGDQHLYLNDTPLEQHFKDEVGYLPGIVLLETHSFGIVLLVMNNETGRYVNLGMLDYL
ncbi:MAG: hypothetical protein H6608_05355 [Flavobacteriales bacterium]|nr:hypothetical protein [Bacteroidota bacterium]MCB9240532.1 hypothetical protein [Flavobacteriales bacterium]